MYKSGLEVAFHLSDIDGVLESDVPKEVEKTLQCVIVLSCPIFSSSPNDIICLDLQKKSEKPELLGFQLTVLGQLNSPNMMWLSRSTMVFLLMLNCRSKLKGSAILLINDSAKQQGFYSVALSSLSILYL